MLGHPAETRRLERPRGITPITVNDRPSIEIARADDDRIRTEATPPERVARIDDVGAAVDFVGVGEIASERGVCAEQAEIRLAIPARR